MANKVKPDIASSEETTKAPVSQIVIPCRTEEKKFRTCEVCGHSNPDHAAICEMCSNYLILGKGD